MDQLPFIISFLKTVRFAYQKKLRVAIFEYDIYLLNRANNTHIAVHENVRFGNAINAITGCAFGAVFETRRFPATFLFRFFFCRLFSFIASLCQTLIDASNTSFLPN